MPTDDPKRTFSRNVKALRKARKISQEELADAIGKSVATISNIERGLLATRLQTAADIADVLGVRLVELFQENPEPPLDQRRQALAEKVRAIVETGDDEAVEALEHVIDAILRLKPQGSAS